MGFGNNYNKLWAYFEEQVQPIYTKLNKTLVCWQELALDIGFYSLPAGAISQAWESTGALYEIIQSGYYGLLSAGWYLDQQIPNPQQTWYEWEDTWWNFYMNEPLAGHPWTPEQSSKVLGGEICMWGEQVDDTNFHSRVFPRAFGAAERLWSLASYNSTTEATPRLGAFRCMLVGRGLQSGPLYPDYCPSVYRQ